MEPKEGGAIVQVINVLGQMIYEQKTEVVNGIMLTNIDLSDNVIKGTYLVRIATNNQTYSGQIVLQK